MTNRFFWLFPSLMGVLLMLGNSSLHADLSVYEGFEYAAGDLVGQSGGTGWSDSWHGANGANSHGTVVADSLKGSTAIVTKGGHMQTSDGDTPMMRGLMNPLFKTPGVTWISFLASNDSGQTDSTYSFLQFTAANGGDDAAIRIGKGYSGKNWEVKSGAQNQDLAVASDNAVVLFVVRVESTGKPGADSVQVFVNPAPGSAPTSPTSALSGLTLKPLDEVVIQSGNGVKTFSYDEIRVGASFADVVPSTAASASTSAPASSAK
jgi:hypothetical protein